MGKTVARMESLLKSAETLSELIDVYCSAFVSRVMLSLSVGITHSFSPGRSRKSIIAPIDSKTAMKYLLLLVVELVERADQTERSSCYPLRPGSLH